MKTRVQDRRGRFVEKIELRVAAIGVAAACAAFAASVLTAQSAPERTVAGLPSPTPLALPSTGLPVSPSVPSILPSPTAPMPTPSLPVTVSPPSVPRSGGSLPTTSAPGGAGDGGGTSRGSTGGNGTTGAPTFPGLPIPFTNVVLTSPFDVGLAVTLAALPLLVAIWLLVFGRTWAQARRERDAQIRLALAADLGLSPRELSSLTTEGLFKLREQAAFDDLTGVMRRAAGIAATEREIARARRQKSPLTVAFVDIDGLKQTNDAGGHAAGDALLKGLAAALQVGLRGQDLVLRYGGDEFVCVLPDTPLSAGADKMRQIQTDARQAGFGFSMGLAGVARPDDVVSLLGRADAELYDAKAKRLGILNLHPAAVRDARRRRTRPETQRN